MTVLCSCSEGDTGVVAYYQSEFEFPAPQQNSLNEAIRSLEEPAETQRGRHGRLLLRPADALNINGVTSGGLSGFIPGTKEVHLVVRM